MLILKFVWNCKGPKIILKRMNKVGVLAQTGKEADKWLIVSGVLWPGWIWQISFHPPLFAIVESLHVTDWVLAHLDPLGSLSSTPCTYT